MGKTIVTHDGRFHADDVFAVAALLLVIPSANILRTRDEARIGRADIVVDVGGVSDTETNRFDHHQIGGAGERANGLPAASDSAAQAGIPYAAFGLVWKKFGERLSGNAAVAARVEEVLVTPIDANDSGIDLSLPTRADIFPYELVDAVRAYIPTWLEKDADIDRAFVEAVACAQRIIEREIKRAEAVVAGKREVETLYRASSDKRIIVLPEDYSWKDTFARFPEPLYVVHPQNGTWRLYCVRDNPHQFVNRKDLPEAWAGLRDAEFAKATSVADAIFCHRNRFMAVAKTKEGAIALAKLALAQQ